MTHKQDLHVVQESTVRLLAEAKQRARWRGRDARVEPFRQVDEIREAARRAGWTVIALDEEAREG